MDPSNDYAHPQRELFLRFKTNISKFIINHDFADIFSELSESGHKEKENIENLSWVSEGFTDDSPCIYAAIHLGPYKTIVADLISKGINLCIPVTEYVYNNKLSEYFDGISTIKGNKIGEVQIVNIETKEGFAKMLACMKSSYSMLMYLDGNSGYGGMSRADSKLSRINLFGKEILVRRGISRLAKLFKLNIIPVISTFNEVGLANIVYLSNCITYHEDINNEDDTIQNLWAIFERFISLYPGQWEAWLYADTYFEKMKSPITNDSAIITFNGRKFDFLTQNNIMYLYDLDCNVKFKIPNTLYNFFQQVINDKISFTREELYNVLKVRNLVDEILAKAIMY